MTEKEVWNEISKETIVYIQDGLDSLNQKVCTIKTDAGTQSNKFLQYTVLQHSEVDSVILQISACGNIAIQAPEKVLRPSSITVAFLTRYLIELYGVLKFLEENPADGMDEWSRYNEIKLAEWSESIKNLGVLKKEFSHINESLQIGKEVVLKEMSERGLNIKNMNSVKTRMENTSFLDTATQIGTKYYQCYQYLSKFTHPTLVGMYSTAADSPEVLHVSIGLTRALMDDFNQLYSNIIDKFGIKLEP